MFKKSAIGLSAIALMSATGAFAETTASASTELNLRAGPGPAQEIIGVIAADDTVDVKGCLDTSNWCQVSYNGTDGWAYGDYLVAKVDQEPVVVYENRAKIGVETVTYEDTTAQSAVSGATMGAIIGGLTGGPIGAAAGAVLGGGTAAVADPGPRVVSYVSSNPVDPIYLDGEVVVGAGIPDAVQLTTVPDSDFSYAYVNGVPVIVEPSERRVVYIVRP